MGYRERQLLMRVVLGCLVGVFGVWLGAVDRVQARPIDFSQEGFRLELPARWIQVPQDVFQERMQQLKKAYSGKGAEETLSYDYALQLKSKEWFAYPYILINIWEDTRVDSDQIQDMNQRLKESLQKKQKGVDKNKLVHSSYDPSRHLYWAETRFELSGASLVLIKGVYYLNQGILVFNSYLPREEYSEYAPDIKQALQSVQLAQANIYRKSADRGWMFNRDVLPYMNVIIATVIVLLLVGILWWKRRRNGSA